MHILTKDLKKGLVKLKVENLDDLWYLSQVIDPGDLISSSTERKIKIGDASEDRSVKVIRKKVFLELRVEKIELNESLRILGTITQGPDDISFGEHHSFNFEENSTLTIIKQQWLKFQLEKLDEAQVKDSQPVLIVVFDREEAFLAMMRKSGIQHLTHISGNVQKKDENNEIKGNFYTYLIKTTEEYDQKFNFSKIICASPAFWKEELSKNLNEGKIKQKIIFATCSSVDKRAFNEVLKRQEVIQALRDIRMSKELQVVERLLEEISKENLAVYGLKETSSAINSGAVSHLLVTTELIKDMREKEIYDKLDNLMKLADSMQSDITLIDSENDAGKKLDGLGGIGAILRYRL